MNPLEEKNALLKDRVERYHLLEKRLRIVMNIKGKTIDDYIRLAAIMVSIIEELKQVYIVCYIIKSQPIPPFEIAGIYERKG